MWTTGNCPGISLSRIQVVQDLHASLDFIKHGGLKVVRCPTLWLASSG